MNATKDRPKLKTAAEVVRALRLRYPDNAYAMLEQVGNSTGFSCRRHGDVVVMSLWPSRGLEIIGIEVKVSRQDWLKELQTPEKAEPIAQYCDRWYLAVGDEAIVLSDELPKSWGLLVPKADGTLRCKVEATLKQPEPAIDRSFLAAILRRAQEQLTPESKLAEEYRRGQKEERELHKGELERELEYRMRDYEALQKAVQEFQEKSGVNIRGAWNVGNLAEAVRCVMHGAYMREKDRLKDLHGRVLQCAEFIANELKTTELLHDEAPTSSADRG